MLPKEFQVTSGVVLAMFFNFPRPTTESAVRYQTIAGSQFALRSVVKVESASAVLIESFLKQLEFDSVYTL